MKKWKEVLTHMLGSAFFVGLIFLLTAGMQSVDSPAKAVLGEFWWYAIFVGLPILSLIAIFIIKCTMADKAMMLSLGVVCLYAIVALGSIQVVDAKLRDFTVESWQQYPNHRYRMLADMKAEHNLMGMTKEEVGALLGEPDGPYADAEGLDLLEYHVGGVSIDPTMLTLVFEDEKVVEVYEYTEFREAKKLLYE